MSAYFKLNVSSNWKQADIDLFQLVGFYGLAKKEHEKEQLRNSTHAYTHARTVALLITADRIASLCHTGWLQVDTKLL